MISRRTALALSEVFERAFYSVQIQLSGSHYPIRRWYGVSGDRLYDFLYTYDYDAWFCNAAQAIGGQATSRSRGTRKLREFILRLHTGETQAAKTPGSSWEERRRLGQQYLRSLAEDALRVYP